MKYTIKPPFRFAKGFDTSILGSQIHPAGTKIVQPRVKHRKGGKRNRKPITLPSIPKEKS